MSQVKVKVCGITRVEDALKAASLGAWAVGFIFYPGSPRFIAPEKAAAIVRALPASLLKVGVFVDESAEAMRAAARASGITAYQLHGDESLESALALDLPWIKAHRLSRDADLAQVGRFAGQKGSLGSLLDAAVKGEYGGTGVVSDWGLAARAKAHGPVILSGGLNPVNVAQALAQVSPFALDLSSGVESAPGIKDHPKLEELFHAVA